MKVEVTHLKAAWPDGTRIGDVVDVGDAIPAWAVGKCKPADAQPVKAESAPAPSSPAKSKR